MANSFDKLAELKAIEHFSKEGYEVYRPMFEGQLCDLILMKAGRTFRVQVKSTEYKTPAGTYQAKLGKARPNRQSVFYHPFDPDVYDFLVVYVGPENALCVYDAKQITNRHNMVIPWEDIKNCGYGV